MDWQSVKKDQEVNGLHPYVYGLAVAIILSGVTAWRYPSERFQILRTAFAIGLVWLAEVLWIGRTLDYNPWAFRILIDGAAALVIPWRPAGNIQGYIGLTYCLQMAMSIGYGLREWAGAPVNQYLYFDALTWVAVVQLLLLGGWGLGKWGKTILDYRRNKRAAVASGARLTRDGEPR